MEESLDKFKPTRLERGLSVAFFLLQFLGIASGMIFCFKLVCLFTGNPLDFDQMDGNCIFLCKLSIIPGMIIGITCFTIPPYYLLIKPFFNRKRVIQFTIAGRNPNLASVWLNIMDLLYKICFFWIDVIYPEKTKKR
jgi:hypothetical protein